MVNEADLVEINLNTPTQAEDVSSTKGTKCFTRKQSNAYTLKCDFCGYLADYGVVQNELERLLSMLARCLMITPLPFLSCCLSGPGPNNRKSCKKCGAYLKSINKST